MRQSSRGAGADEGQDPARRRIWRLLRLLLPAGFRDRRSAAILDTHVALAGGPSAARGVRFWSRVTWDIVTTAAQMRMDTLRSDSRERPADTRRTTSVLDAVPQSLLMAVRSLKRTPYFALSVVLILALGISANVTIFRVLDRLLLSPPEQIVSPDEVKRVYVLGRWIFTGEVEFQSALAYPDYRALSEVSGFASFAGYSSRRLTMVEDGAGERVSAELATASYFETLGVRPAVGRFYGADEDVVGASSHVAVLGWSFWQSRFSGDADVLGRELVIGKGRYTIVGVAPRGFTGVDLAAVDFWLPFHVASEVESETADWVDAGTWYVMSGVARVPGPLAAAEAAATAATLRAREGGRNADPDARVVLAPLIAAHGPQPSSESRVAALLAVLAVLVLLLTCANVGNLYVARVLGRGPELAVQAALGVGRWRLFTQLLAEVLVVALVAGLIAWWVGVTAANALFDVLLPDAALATADGPRIAQLTVALAVVTALLTGVLPALRATRVQVMDALRGRATTARALTLRRALLVVQTALSVVLLVGAGLFIDSLRRATTFDFGLDTGTTTIDVELSSGAVFGAPVTATLERILPAVRGSGLVERAALTSLAPFSGWWGLALATPQGDSVPSSGSGPFVYGVSGDYFSTVGLPIVSGRPITDADGQPGAAPVMVVNERLAQRLWPGDDPLGRCVFSERADASRCSTVVGVARDFLPEIGAQEAPFVFYVPRGHEAVGAASANTLLVQPRPGVTSATLRDLVLSAAPGLRMATVSTLGNRLAPALRAWRLGATLLTAVGVLALLIAAAGLYSMLTFDLAQRRRELGIRAALGASAVRLIGDAVRASFAAVAAGVLLGLGASFLGGRGVESLLFQVRAHDLAVYTGACVTLLAVGLLATVLPARGVTRTDPATVLREE